jgi:hypothetical protein
MNASGQLETSPQTSDSPGEDDRRQQQHHERDFADQCLHVLLLDQQALCTPDTGIRAPHQGAIPPEWGLGQAEPIRPGCKTRSRTADPIALPPWPPSRSPSSMPVRA